MSNYTFIAGQNCRIDLGASPVVTAEKLTFNRTRNATLLPIFRGEYQQAIGGQKTGTVGSSGHVAIEEIAALEANFEEGALLAYLVQLGLETQEDDGGSYTGLIVVTSYNIGADANGKVDWTMDGTFNGAPTWAPGAPSAGGGEGSE